MSKHKILCPYCRSILYRTEDPTILMCSLCKLLWKIECLKPKELISKSLGVKEWIKK